MRRSRVRISFAPPGKALRKRGFFFGFRRVPSRPIGQAHPGEVAERSNAAVLKTALPSRVTGVRIPPSPPTRPAQRAAPSAAMLPSLLEAARLLKEPKTAKRDFRVEASPLRESPPRAIPPSPPTRPAQRAFASAAMLPSLLEAAGMLKRSKTAKRDFRVEASPPSGKARLGQSLPLRQRGPRSGQLLQQPCCRACSKQQGC